MSAATTLHGIAVSPGFAIGKAHLVARGMPDVPHYCLAPSHVAEERERFLLAVEASHRQLLEVRKRLAGEKINQELLYILDAHGLILEDRMLREGTLAYIDQQVNAEWAVKRYLSEILFIFNYMDDSYLQEKRRDIEQVAGRILNNLLGNSMEPISGFPNPVILVGEEFTPSDTLLMNHETVLGFVTQWGGRASHTTIIAKSLGLPAIVGVPDVTTLVKQGDLLVVDGVTGGLHIQPDDQLLGHFQSRLRQFRSFRTQLLQSSVHPAQTRDGHRVLLKANIELHGDAQKAVQVGADGIGLFRTEHFYMNRPTPPGEEELFQAFHGAVKTMQGLPVTIRTLDVGGEKQSNAFGTQRHQSENPALGLQGVRLCLKKERGAFLVQLRAILRVSNQGDVRILLPMISGISELEEALAVLAEAKRSLKKEGIAFDQNIKVGAMIEVPAAALCADQIAKRVDFLSIGTNDLVQFTLAVGRVDDAVAYLYEPAHPAVLKLIKMAVGSAKRCNVPVSVCGEMAGDPRYAILLTGLGLQELSITPSCLPLIRRTIRGIDYSWAVKMCKSAQKLLRPEDINAFLEQEMKAVFGQEHMFH